MATNFGPFAPAFPGDTPKGLTVLDYFAAAALQGILAATKPGDVNADTAAEEAVKCADALVEKLSERHSTKPRPTASAQ